LHYLENAIRATGAKTVAIRAAYFQDNLGQALGPARQMGKYFNMMPSRDATLPTIATKDIGVLVAKTLVSPPPKSEVIDHIGPMYKVSELVEKLGAALGKQLDIVDVPAANQVGAMVQGGVPKPYAEQFAEMYGAFGTGRVTPKGDRIVPAST